MSDTDELAYLSASETARPHPLARALAGRGRRRRDRAHRGAQSRSERLRPPRLRRCARAGARSRAGGHVRCRARAAARRPDGHEGPLRLQARLAEHVRRRARAQGLRARLLLRLRRAHRARRRDPARQDQQPGDGLPRHLRQPAVRPDPAIRSISARTPAARRAAAPRRWPTASFPSPRAPTEVARSASRRHGAGSTASRARSGGYRWSSAERLLGRDAVRRRGPDRPHRRRRRAGPDRALGL